MKEDKLKVVIEVPEMNDAWGGHCDIFAKIPRYKKWWEFWKNNYEEKPCIIKEFITPTKKMPKLKRTFKKIDY